MVSQHHLPLTTYPQGGAVRGPRAAPLPGYGVACGRPVVRVTRVGTPRRRAQRAQWTATGSATSSAGRGPAVGGSVRTLRSTAVDRMAAATVTTMAVMAAAFRPAANASRAVRSTASPA